MNEKRFTRTIAGSIYCSETDSFVDKDFKGKPISYEDGVIKLLNELAEENEQLKSENNKLKKENDELQQELFEAEEEYLLETYHDNPVRRDDKIEMLKEEFKERFGRDFE